MRGVRVWGLLMNGRLIAKGGGREGGREGGRGEASVRAYMEEGCLRLGRMEGGREGGRARCMCV